ncbi:speckle-type POZ protein B-like [Nasonia vitripennis]|uniref:MATH domain-containing protein n=1 Tax=Nasonia vitripennis TaxID=7425 RepID=A0A7M7H8L6_NASVI|nr:speckle-type POZ protein B-like [Nasonia vitripennis]
MSVANNKWGLTQVKINKCNYIWTINNFSYLLKQAGEELKPPCLSIGNGKADEPRWCLRLYPKGINESFKDYLSLYFYRNSGADYRVEGRYELSLLNEPAAFPAFVKRELITDKANGLLVDDSLTFRCEIAMIVGNVSFSSEDYESSNRPFRAGGLQSLSSDFEKMSPIFSAMFEHDMLENKLAAVKIVDVEHHYLI